ncbi:hypothetical protein [Oryza sativa Japonica Group]|uniref:Uncharacterized protein n=1 Tax=Oryza sativa subsp. japonica TaxID=39947 RepID=Q5Z8F0_ORYSJ|nr:hypothetical protein [Oryza sativa Japonica Group]
MFSAYIKETHHGVHRWKESYSDRTGSSLYRAGDPREDLRHRISEPTHPPQPTKSEPAGAKSSEDLVGPARLRSRRYY